MDKSAGILLVIHRSYINIVRNLGELQNIIQANQCCKYTLYLLEWAIALHGRVLVPCLQMNATHHDSNIMINLPIWEVISCLLFKYFPRVKSLLYLLVLSQ